MSAAAIDTRLLELIENRTAPEPDGVTNAEGNVWTSTQRLKQEASKNRVDCTRDEVEDAVERLVNEREAIRWHGLLAPATREHLEAIIENETLEGKPRKILVGKCNQLRSELKDAEEVSA